jgi:hypothetical protein
MRKRTSMVAVSGALAITAALTVATAGLAAASPVPVPAAPMQPAKPAPAITPYPPAASKTAAHPAAPSIKNRPAVPAAKARSGGVTPALTPPITSGSNPATTCSGTAFNPTGSVPAGPAGPCGTTVTFTVTTGVLSITVPTSVDLGSGPAGGSTPAGTTATPSPVPTVPGVPIQAALGPVTVTDDRALLTAAWTATVGSTDFANTTLNTTAPAIPAGDVFYFSGDYTTAIGVGTPAGLGGTPAAIPISIVGGQPGTLPPLSTGTPPGAALANSTGIPEPVTAMTLTLGVGANQVTWDPTISVKVPATAVSGIYSGTITHSVA